MKVLIAIDEQACIEKVFEFVDQHNFPEDVEFKIVHAISPVLMDQPLPAYPLFFEPVTKEIKESARALLTRMTARIQPKSKVPVVCETRIGSPVYAVLEAGKEWKCDLIIVGSHFRQGFQRFLEGSVAYDIAMHAPCSVIVLKIDAIKRKVESTETPLIMWQGA